MSIKTEYELKQQVVLHLQDDFDLISEVKGTFLVDQSNVRIDYMALAKPHIINSGFSDEWLDRMKEGPNRQR